MVDYKAISLAAILIFAGMTMVIDYKDDNSESSVDYSLDSNWLTLPSDPSEHAVDVFYLYPTVYQGNGNQDITDPGQVDASMVPVRTQASVFDDVANIFAPMYRQVGKAGFSDENLTAYLDIAETDAKDAFLYYLEHLNDGRPFILAGHSQGSSSFMSFMPDIWGNLGCEDRMIAAYIIGFSVTQSDIEKNGDIRMCEGPTDTGCFISYNSLRDGLQNESIQILEGAIVTNPLSWVSAQDGSEIVPATENLGAVFFSDDGFDPQTYPEFTSAMIKDHGLVCDPADTSVLSYYPIDGIYHPDDYSLFYMNLKDNIADRIDAFLDERS